MGVDVARFGFDKSALCVRQGERVLLMRSFDRMDTMRLVHEVLGTVRETGAEAVFVDEGGVGGGVVDRLRELGAPVYGVHFGGGAQRPTRFFNRRSEIFWELRRLFDLQADRAPARRGAWPGSCSGCATTSRVRARCGWRASGRCASAACRRRTRRTRSRSRSWSRRRSASGRAPSRSSATTTHRWPGQRSRPSATTRPPPFSERIGACARGRRRVGEQAGRVVVMGGGSDVGVPLVGTQAYEGDQRRGQTSGHRRAPTRDAPTPDRCCEVPASAGATGNALRPALPPGRSGPGRPRCPARAVG